MDPVKTSPVPALDPVAFTEKFERAAAIAGFRVRHFGEIGGFPLVAATRRTRGPKPRIYLSSGIHGDEPAPPQTLLRLLAEGCFDDRAHWFICPLLNPRGFTTGRRDNPEGLDLNRDYRHLRAAETRAHVAWLERQPPFDLVFAVHEDWEATGFYLYELNPQQRPTLANALLAGAEKHCPIETSVVIDGREIAERGIIRPVSDPALRDSWPESIYLRNFHATLTYTTETPSGLPVEQRIAAHAAALRGALTAFCAANS